VRIVAFSHKKLKIRIPIITGSMMSLSSVGVGKMIQKKGGWGKGGWAGPGPAERGAQAPTCARRGGM